MYKMFNAINAFFEQVKPPHILSTYDTIYRFNLLKLQFIKSNNNTLSSINLTVNAKLKLLKLSIVNNNTFDECQIYYNYQPNATKCHCCNLINF